MQGPMNVKKTGTNFPRHRTHIAYFLREMFLEAYILLGQIGTLRLTAISNQQLHDNKRHSEISSCTVM